MGLFNIFNKKDDEVKVNGDIKYYDLINWWQTELSEDERNRIIEVYQPMGSSRSIIEGNLTHSSGNHLNFLSNLAGWFNNKTDRSIAIKILNKAKEYLDKSPVLDVHFYYQAVVDVYYPERDKISDAMKIATEACINQIAIATKAAEAFKKEYPEQSLPSHVGYKQLAIIREKQKNYDDAIEICEKAFKQGWGGDWKKRVDRMKKKLLITNK